MLHSYYIKTEPPNQRRFRDSREMFCMINGKYSDGLFTYSASNSSIVQSEDVQKLISYIKRLIPNNKVIQSFCTPSNRVISRSPVPEYGIHIIGTFDVYIKIVNRSELEIRIFWRKNVSY